MNLYIPEQQVELPEKPLEKDLINLYIEICKVDRDGNEIPHRLFRTNSWTKQMAQLMYGRIARANATSVKDTGGTLRTISQVNNWRCFLCPAPTANSTYGIVVGTSTTTPTEDDHALGAPIAHGQSSGQLYHQAMTFARIALTSPDGYRLTLARQFDNDSGAQITVEEMGLITQNGATAYNFLCLHDLINEAIPNGESRVFKYHLDFIA